MNKKVDYIFSINTGRSGSDYLFRIFNHVSECQSFHERYPVGNAKEMRAYSRGNSSPMQNIAEKKIEIIKNLRGDSQIYFESNHCFIKGFGWFIPNYLPEDRIGVIILKREKSKIAESLLRIGCSPLTSYGRNWINTPDTKDPFVEPFTTPVVYQSARFTKLLVRASRLLARKLLHKEIPNPQWLVDYELQCLEWYIEETYARADAFRKKYPTIKYYEVNIEDLNSLEAVQKMLEYFGCNSKQSLTNVVGKPSNLKRENSVNK